MLSELDSLDCVGALLKPNSAYASVRSCIQLSLPEVLFAVIDVDDVESGPKISVFHVNFEGLIVAGVLVQGDFQVLLEGLSTVLYAFAQQFRSKLIFADRIEGRTAH